MTHGHGHGHHHGHGSVGEWRTGARDPVLRLVVALVGVLLLLTVVGVIALWPDGSGRQSAIDTADELGLGSTSVEAEVVEVTDARCSFVAPDASDTCRTFTFELTSGPDAGETIVLPEFSLEFEQNVPPVSVGDGVILGYDEASDTYFYSDRDRRGSMVWLVALFALVVVALGRLRGALALLAMASTVVVLVAFVAPSVLDGNDPVLVCVVAASVIAFVSLYLSHGVSPTTTVALASTLLALVLTLALSWFFFERAGFTGLATEEASLLPFLAGDIDLAALLLGGAILGALGALDDVTVTQVATVAELRAQRPDLGAGALFASGVRVGREHIASTVNTLLLAYVGAGIPLLLLFAASEQPLGIVANSEAVAVEIVRTLCGSIGLVAAVPIATGLTALVVARQATDVVDHAAAEQPSAPPTPPPATPPVDPPAESAGPAAEWDDFAPEGDFWEDRGGRRRRRERGSAPDE